MTEYHDRASGPPRAQFDRALGEPESELQATAREVLTELGYVWLGDLAGWEIVPVYGEAREDGLWLELRHRCGWARRQPFEGITGDGAAYVGNILERLMEVAPGHACAPHEPSPEHQARVARWTAAAGLTPSGDVAADQLAVVRAASRNVDGPGCTPASVRVECLGDSCTGCTDPQCWTARADGGDV